MNENTSLRPATLSALKEYEELELSLLASLQQPKAPSSYQQQAPGDILRKIIIVDERLQRLVDEVELHQETQTKLDATLQQIEQHNVMILSLVRRLQSAQHTLQAILSDAGDKVLNSRRAGEEPLDYKSLISYARRVANTTSAPPTGTNMPPIPQDADMKLSRLFWSPEDLLNGRPEAEPGLMGAVPSNLMDVDTLDEEEQPIHGASSSGGLATAGDLLDLDL
ncbi:hypothetical protein SmJEL517_g01392 [Synchytrium microbalum]|uniref:Mediator of RNA polymerase II transcription subunit 4 n=1 Tax=Synchytrium microbalum TaxID=1806994 RepID=A0A507CAB2_9FUNG|nr:uncharacterized protein SmJEL517_g01392 [Synchytrium microbalum]TPX36542.1 hypothetical protein SmJEL517_g01392 [Synchytrium microbalum]